eukprot:Em0002g1300a
MDAAGRGRQRGRSKRPISLSGWSEGGKATSHSCDDQMVQPGEQKKSEHDSDLRQLKGEIKSLKEKLSVAEIESRTFRDDFQQERRDRERAVERCDSLQQMMADFERQSEKYKEENADLTEQLNAARQTIAQQVAELEVAKEEIAVKVAQVKQYQKQVEAYKKQLDVSKTGGEDSCDVDQKRNQKRKSDHNENGSKRFKQSMDSAHGYAEYSTEETDSDSLPPPIIMNVPDTRGLSAGKHETQQLMGATTNSGITSRDGFKGAAPSMVDTRYQRVVSRASIPDDPNLQCPICREIFKKGEIQKFRLHVQRCSEFMQ